MRNWLRELDDTIFGPPHKFGEVLALVTAALGVEPDEERKSSDLASKDVRVQDRPEERIPERS